MFGITKLFKCFIVVAGGFFLAAPQIMATSPVPKPICEPPVIISETFNFRVQHMIRNGWRLALYLSDEKVWIAGAMSSEKFSQNKKNEIVLKFEEGHVFKINMSDMHSDGNCYYFSSKKNSLN